MTGHAAAGVPIVLTGALRSEGSAAPSSIWNLFYHKKR